jgi:phthalate 4,5-dioxygenase reductase subunit
LTIENPLNTQSLQTQATQSGWMPLQVVRKECIATDVYLFELAAPDTAVLAPFEPGAHITLLTPNGLTRRYSLCNSPHETRVYRIAVKREAQGLGGSVSLVDHVAVGGTIPVSAPLNYFPLHTGAPSFLLIAGGIGITPILSMARALQAIGADFRIIYLARTPASAAFHAELCADDLRAHSVVHHNHGDPSRKFDLSAALEACSEGAHIYCCGPRRLMESVRDLTRGRPGGHVHFEDFGSSEPAPQHQDRPFQVRLVQKGITLEVPTGVTILEVLRRSGVVVPSSCESGTCGACRTKLVSGLADHRDYVLDDDQHDTEIMICVSRAKSAILEIDV